MPQPQASVVRSIDGRFFNIPEAVLKRYRVKPDKLSAEEKNAFSAKPKSKGNGRANGETNGEVVGAATRGTVQVIINVAPDGSVRTSSSTAERSGQQWIYEPPSAGPAIEWGDDFDPTGGMSSAARRG